MSNIPAYPIRGSAMRPVTKITILGLRLGVVVLIAYWALIFLGTHLPAAADFSPKISDKTKHFGAFWGLGTLMCYVTTSQQLWRRFGTIAIVGLAYAAVDEMTQQLIPGRVADLWDFAADAAGLLTAIALYLAAKGIARRG